MTIFRNIFSMEFKRYFFSKRFFVFLLFTVLIAIIVHFNCLDYKAEGAKSKEFQKIDGEIFSMLPNYTAYRAIGTRILCIPGPLKTFFYNSGSLIECTARITPHVSLHIFEDLKSSSLFQKKQTVPFDFSGILFVFGTLYSILVLGFETLRNKEYLRMLCSTSSNFGPYFSKILSRLIILIIQLAFIFFVSFVVSVFHNIGSSSAILSSLVPYFLLAILVMTSLFSLGCLIGQLFKSTWKGVSIILALWAAFVLIWPGMVDAYVKKAADKITSQHKIELNKISISVEFEKRIEDKYGVFDRGNIEVERKIIEGFWNDDYKKISGVEEAQKSEISKVIDKYNILSLLTPTTLYTMSAMELSSQGYGSFLNFYSYVNELNKKFVRFFIDRIYYNDPKVMVNFIKGDENLFFAKSRLPKKFWTGILITLGWIIALQFFSYRAYKKSLFQLNEKDLKIIRKERTKENFKSKEYRVWYINDNCVVNLLYILLSGQQLNIQKHHLPIEITLDNEDITKKPYKENFLYLPDADSIPGDIKAKDLVILFAKLNNQPKENIEEVLESLELKEIAKKRFKDLETIEKAEVLLSLTWLSKCSIFLFHNIAPFFNTDFIVRFNERLESLKNEGAAVIFMSQYYFNQLMGKTEIDTSTNEQTENWKGILESHIKAFKKEKATQ